MALLGVPGAAAPLAPPDLSKIDSAKVFAAASRQTNNISPVGVPLPPTADIIKYGAWMYQGLCVRCHGVKGDGEGADWLLTPYNPTHWLPRQPRNFSDPVFKLRSTPSGSLPIDRDLFESISRGLQADKDMPSFKFLPERDRWALVVYLKNFTKRWTEEQVVEPVKISEPPMPDAAMLSAGQKVYKKMQCARCHGDGGKGDGISANELKDDNNLPIVPRDFTDPNQFLGPSDPKGIYRTFTTGLDGTPMPSYADSLDETRRWELVWHVISLRPGWTLEGAQRERATQAAPPAAIRKGTSAAQAKPQASAKPTPALRP